MDLIYNVLQNMSLGILLNNVEKVISFFIQICYNMQHVAVRKLHEHTLFIYWRNFKKL